MNRHVLACALFAFTVFRVNDARSQAVLADLTQETTQEAIRLGADERAARKFLQAYVLQTRTGVGNGPLLGYWSTPFARVVLAAAAARKEGKTFAVSDVAPELRRPEIYVLIFPQPAAYEVILAAVQAVVVVRRSGDQETVITPVSAGEATKGEVAVYGVPSQINAMVFSFPLSAAVSDSAVKVTFSHVVRGSSALTNCRDCIVPFDVTTIR
jgi:hypothetical protein